MSAKSYMIDVHLVRAEFIRTKRVRVDRIRDQNNTGVVTLPDMGGIVANSDLTT